MKEIEEIKEKQEHILAMLEANIAKMNKIVAESQKDEKTQKQAEILNEAQKRINSLSEELSLKFEAFGEAMNNFKPIVEHRTVFIDVKKPLAWVLSATGVMILCFTVAFVFYNLKEKEREAKEYYQAQNEVKEDNFYKYKYLRYFSGRELSGYLIRFDDDFQAHRSEWIKMVIEREEQIGAAARAAREADIKRQEAREAQQKLDSIKQKLQQ